MKRYREMTSAELVDLALGWHSHSSSDRRIIFALACRLKEECTPPSEDPDVSGFDNLTTQDLVDRALQSRYTTGENAHQMVAALAKRLKAHHHRVAALEQRLKAQEQMGDIHEETRENMRRLANREQSIGDELDAANRRIAELEQRANTNRPGPGYVLVGKPHVSKCSIGWRCVGPGQTTQFGVTPSQAYQCWAQMIARRPYHPRRHFMPVEP